jgi:hypothetical protein
MKKRLAGVQIKNADLGLVEAVFSTFDVVDLDGDVTRKGAFDEGAAVVISAYGHKSHTGALPIGKGTIHEVGDKAILKGQLFVDTTHGLDAFTTIKHLAEEAGLQEWSYSLQDVVAERATIDGKAVRVITKVKVKEVSPVLIGAGIDTGTLAVKSEDAKQLASSLVRLLSVAGRDRWPDSWTYLYDHDPDNGFAVYGVEGPDGYSLWQVSFTRSETSVELGPDEVEVHPTTVFLAKSARYSTAVEAALRSLKHVGDMTRERLASRVAEGKSIDEQLDAHSHLIAEVDAIKAAIDTHTIPTVSRDEIEHEWLRSVANQVKGFAA